LYSLKIEKDVDRIFSKLSKKEPNQLNAIMKKIQQILKKPQQFKPLKFPLQHLRRVHVGSFVIIYSIEEINKVVAIEDYEHHDELYK